jgi:uncharacterized protein involved in response to NO
MSLPSLLLPRPRPATGADCVAEPFRVLFPLGVVLGILGVSLWPLHFLGVLAAYPGPGHARIMVTGFFGAFMFGFLGTALPRMLGVRLLGPGGIGLLAAGLATGPALRLAGLERAADAVFAALLLGFMAAAARRFGGRDGLPPPDFVLVALGLLCGLGGSLTGALVSDAEAHAAWLLLGNRLLHQGFLLLPVLGVGGFLFPRMPGAAGRQEQAAARRPSPAWRARAWEALATGAVIVATFPLEVWGAPRTAQALRAAALAAGLWRSFGPAAGRVPATTFGAGLRLGLALTLGAPLLAAWQPAQRVGWLHLMLAGGLVLVTLAVATRMIWGHGGEGPRLGRRQRWWRVAAALLLLGTVTRISGDFWPKILPTHYSYGAVLWTAGMLVWAAHVLPAVRRAGQG